MAIIAPFQSRYLIGANVTSIATKTTFDASVIGIKTGDAVLLTKNQPHISPGLNLIDNPKSTGQSLSKANELVLGNNRPNVTVQFDFNAYVASIIFWSFFQGGVSESATTPFVKTAIPYTTPEASVWLSLLEVNSTSDEDENNAAHGGIVNQITLRSDEESQVVDCEAQIGFAEYEDDYDASAIEIDDPQTTELVFKDMVSTLAGDDVNLVSFDITFNNNAATRFFNNTTAVKHVLGMLEITGTIVIPRDAGDANWDKNQFVTNLLAKTDTALALYWGASPATADAQLSIIINILPTDVVKVTEVELGWSVQFKVVDDESNSVSITWADTIDIGI